MVLVVVVVVVVALQREQKAQPPPCLSCFFLILLYIDVALTLACTRQSRNWNRLGLLLGQIRAALHQGSNHASPLDTRGHILLRWRGSKKHRAENG